MDPLDRIDLGILETLQRNGRMTNADLAHQVSLSPSPCLRRVRQLEAQGVIRGYAALVDPWRVGLGLQAYVTVTLDKRGDTQIRAFHAAVGAWPEVLSCFALTGEMDYLLHVVVEDLEHFSRFLMDRLLKLDGVANVKSSFVLQTVKHTTALPLEGLARQAGPASPSGAKKV
ncbi:Lrp/AsnC family transcriptional regulator [Denitromonas iodatirespirans]|uniref:Lrp/AsnC family transcriptional regulator n=1 Tax=Denitromonas iodatirespirans TaxID=2795389 RepID=A0A944D6S9_DENI1|nr:Lrp/AsnC family transcriptional regulator [Denitromonas iodatirespirans]MBT0960989.1 Lrp/AsnC family transcriptional regulator [Denitromonas iodatirespirans]